MIFKRTTLGRGSFQMKRFQPRRVGVFQLYLVDTSSMTKRDMPELRQA